MHLLEERPVLSVGPVCGAMFRCSSATTCHRRCGVFWRVSALSCRLHARRPATRNPTPGSDEPLEGRLDSWKEIAAYLGRGIRTVQRWEREEGLPVHRLAHEKRGSIYARREELAAWWESRRLTLAAPPTPDAG